MHPSSRSLALVSLFAALIAVFGLIPKIDLPLGVPITLQTLGVMLAGCMLGAKRGLQALMNIANLSWEQAIMGTLVFVPGDLIKCALCATVVQTVARGLPDWRFGG